MTEEKKTAPEQQIEEEPKAAQPAKKGVKASTIRAFTAALVFVAVGVGLAIHTGTGTLSSFGWDVVATICPLGALESMLGAWAFVPRLVIALVAMILIIFVAGKAFCSWLCPVPHIQDLFKSKKRKELERKERLQAADLAVQNWKDGTVPEHQNKKVELDSRHAVLGGALLSTAIFGFPVFCLVCPVGLTLGTFVLLWRFIQFNEPTWGLIIFPIIIILEVLVLRRWCHTICPLGALMSLISKANKTFRPTVDTNTCLRDTEGAACQACAAACPEHIDPYADLGERSMSECVKCRGCVDACPMASIHLPFLPKKEEAQK